MIMTEIINSTTLGRQLKITERELMGYSLGGLMYTPAHNKKACDFLISKKYSGLRSAAFCLEDAIADGSEAEALNTLENTFTELNKAVNEGQIDTDDLPYLFVRVKSPEQMKRVFELTENSRIFSGFIFPKFDVGNAYIFLENLLKINETADNIMYGMPILESVSIADVKFRIQNLSQLKDITDSYREFIVNIRIGGNDFCSRYGVRRKINDTIYDIRVISDIISDIVNIFSADYVVSAPVWEYFENPNDSSEGWKTGLRTECEKDIINGLFGKTAIHPSQLPVIDDVMAVTYSDYMDALSILNWNDSSLAVSKSAEGNRMNEQKVHTRWAEKVLLRSAIYGIRENK